MIQDHGLAAQATHSMCTGNQALAKLPNLDPRSEWPSLPCTGQERALVLCVCYLLVTWILQTKVPGCKPWALEAFLRIRRGCQKLLQGQQGSFAAMGQAQALPKHSWVIVMCELAQYFKSEERAGREKMAVTISPVSMELGYNSGWAQHH